MKVYKVSTLGVCGWFLMMGFCAQAQAQAVASFEELRSSLKLTAGESVQVTSQDGTTVKGKLVTISDRTIAVIVKGIRQEMSESAIREIRHRRPDKWWNGALIGLGVGVVAGAVVPLALCESDLECQVIVTSVFVPTFAGIGAGAGALIDFGIQKHETVYASGGVPVRQGMRVSPLLSKDRKGVRVAFSF